ncbi:MAG: hypothetical protein U0176_14040 [Bacteroidia bacterium]
MSDTPKPIQIGKFRISSPCSLDWDELQPADGQNRFCLQCQKQVVDISGMTMKEVEAAYKSSGSKLCVAVNITPDRKAVLRQEPPRPHWRLARKLLASASILLLAPLVMPAMSPNPKAHITHSPRHQAPPSNVPTTETNTLVSGVIVREGNEYLVNDSLEVVIRHRGRVVSRLMAVGGFFHVDLAEHLNPKDLITVEVKGKIFDLGEKYHQRRYGDGKLETSLGNAQNLQVHVEYTPPKRNTRVMGRMSF